MARSHSFATTLFVLMATPTKKPTIAEREERKLKRRAGIQWIPHLIRIPKSAKKKVRQH